MIRIQTIILLSLSIVFFLSGPCHATDFIKKYGIHGQLITIKKTSGVEKKGKKLLAVYMVGSDLESGDMAGTSDLFEMIEGKKNLSSDNLEIIIAFGGAAKPGWEGMKIATFDQIIEDSKDKIFGNLKGGYLYNAPGAHMGDENTLTFYLKFLNEHHTGYQSTFLVLWNHGASYFGYGNDENFNGDGLTLKEIDHAFAENHKKKFNLIGFDACLMASLEVAEVMKTYTDFLLASEETEPGHGWNWKEVVLSYGEEKEITKAGERMIDNYILDESHPIQDVGKTLSLADLKHFDNLYTKLSDLCSYLKIDFTKNTRLSKRIMKASRKTQDFGDAEKEKFRFAIDLKHFLLNIEKKVKDKKSRHLTEELKKATASKFGWIIEKSCLSSIMWRPAFCCCSNPSLHLIRSD